MNHCKLDARHFTIDKAIVSVVDLHNDGILPCTEVPRQSLHMVV